MLKKIVSMLVILMTFLLNQGGAFADDSTDASKINWIEGPKTVDIGSDLAKLDLPSDYVFADGKDAKEIMKEMDNTVTNREQGIVFSKDNTQNWYVLFEFDDMGYVRDNDADKIDADKLLSEIKDGTEEDNKERVKNGKSTLDIIGWDEKPHYDSNTHNLVWSVLAKSDGREIINYNVRILGRGGVTEVTLVADKDEMEKVKPNLETIVSKYSYKEGNRYTDYVNGDKVAQVGGVAALIAGGAGAAKLGIFAKILIVLKKIWILIIVGIGGVFKKIAGIFRRRSKINNSTNLNSNEIGFNENPQMDTKNEIASTASDSQEESN
ncbi:DUF2167 domain-containing protein [uncultured Clostridium sp.]|uniref:DUF2167 domain-containing protein n=1 Tax=uncultured Clostridium sp. TaxID=59620 RepID=UPI0028EBBC9B|nr:DUF2167 domain-containing protein [uncultured Clostridium sp.]